MDLASLALALGSSLTAGLNLYITILALGLMNRYDILSLPADLQVLANPWVLATAAVLFLIEFVADKIPYIDNTWDVLHTFIRVPAGAVLAASAVGDVPDYLLWTAALVGGFVTFAAHGAKASTRLAVNSTPEPFTNWTLSVLEDVLSVSILWLVAEYPYIALALGLIVLAGCILAIYIFYRFFKMLFQRREQTV